MLRLLRVCAHLIYPYIIMNAIKQLKSGKTAGPDKVPTKIVKDVDDLMSKPLSTIFNPSLENGIFPDIWKLAKVTPIFKSGAKMM